MGWREIEGGKGGGGGSKRRYSYSLCPPPPILCGEYVEPEGDKGGGGIEQGGSIGMRGRDARVEEG